MTRRTMLLSLLALLVVAGSGCRGIHRGIFPSPFRFGCDPQYCGPVCGPSCGPVCEADCGPVCDEPCGPACPPDCGPCGPCGPCQGPLTWVFNLFRCGVWPDCSGCGEAYWGGYIDTPPDCCDPCDCYGNWTGGSCAGGDCGGQGYAVQGGMPGTVAPGGCSECGQSHAAAVATPSTTVPRTATTGTPHLAPTRAPRQAWRPRTPTVRQ